MLFEIKDKRRNQRILIIGENYRAYEHEDGSVHLNDEHRGYTFEPDESYEDFRNRMFHEFDTGSH